MKEENAREAEFRGEPAGHNPMRHLYVHFPFCARICPYCAFYKTRATAPEFGDFCQALMLEMSRVREIFPWELETIFFGGGTPTAHSTAQLQTLCAHLRATFELSALREWSTEANPGSVSIRKATALRHSGITRVSLGVQSWDNDLLKLLGREHDAAQAEESFRILRTAGFENVSIDLMFALPGQTEAQWRETLVRTITLQPEHISTYCLTYEEETEFLARFAQGEFVKVEETEARFLEIAMQELTDAGYEHYEISNYARPGFRSQHNQAYWCGADYLGLGPSAFSTRGGRRWQNIANHHEYARRLRVRESPVALVENLSPEMKRTERIALGLRTSEGLPVTFLSQPRLAPLLAEGLLQRSGQNVSLSRKGRLLADAVAAELL